MELTRTITAKRRELPNRLGCVLAGRYVLGAVIGQGSESVVYEAEDRLMQCAVAVKLIECADPETARASFESELLCVNVGHPGVNALIDAGDADGVPFVVRPRMLGESLASAIASGPLATELVVAIFVELSSALQAVHDAGVIHRDIKPSNVFLERREACAPITKLFDFGCACAATALEEGTFVGTPAYIAPEQARGERIDGRADIYALGITLFEALAGRRPYMMESCHDLTKPDRERRVVDVRDLRSDVPASVADVIATAMAREPEDRFASARELQLALTAPRSSQIICYGPHESATRIIAASRAAERSIADDATVVDTVRLSAVP